jgi:hypothetical protein
MCHRRRDLIWTVPLAAALLPLGCPAPVRAAAGAATGGAAGPTAGSIGMVVLLVFCVAAAYLAAHFVVDRLQRRLLIMSGIEYLLLGILLGPLVPQIHAFDDLTPLMPFIALAAGWIGLLRGTELQLRHIGELPFGTVRVTLVHHLVTGALVGAGAWFFMMRLLPQPPFRMEIPWEQAALSAGVLGCCAAADSAGPIELLGRRYELGARLTRLLKRSALLGDMLVVFVFGLLFCVFHQGSANVEGVSLRATEWAVLSVGIGLVLGILFTAFLGDDESPNGRFLALVGITTFAAGAAWFLQLDPLLVNMTLGVVLVNTSQSGSVLRSTLQGTQRPLSLVLLILAGALWRPPEPLAALVGLGGFVVLRVAGKVLGSWLTAWGTSLRPDLFRGLLGHGEITVAMVVSFRLVYEGPAVDLAYTVVLASVLLHDLVAPRLLRSLLVDAGEIHGETTATPEPVQGAG